jgi:predicted nucleic acid-binding protein
MTVVVDSNIFIAFVLTDEPHHGQAQRLLTLWQDQAQSLAAPRLLKSELTAVMRKAVFQGRISHDQGTILLSRVLQYPLELYEDDDLLREAYRLAHHFGRPRAYDTQYMALAHHLECDFWTADERLFNAVKTQFSRIRWLGNT